jgi:uncharacterized repeat protein (TIGR03803 family)
MAESGSRGATFPSPRSRKPVSEKKFGCLKLLAALFAFCQAAIVPAHPQTFQSVIAFDGTNGAVPTDALVQGANGDLYGTTQYGGNANLGTIFQLTTSGTLTTLYSFCSQSKCIDGSQPDASLVQGSDGSLYGTTFFGGANNQGTVFTMGSSGSLTTLYSFCSLSKCADGANPHAGLIEASDGNFYGTTSSGGAKNAGVVFEITASGSLTTLYSFCSLPNCADGSTPEGGLIQTSSGNFYGTTSQGGANGHGGTVFQLTSDGTLTTLYSFCSLALCADGEYPYAGVVQGKDGNFYSTTELGGTNAQGTIFKITPSGTLTTLYNFCSLALCADGESPYAGVMQGKDGNFYGTTELGGTDDTGTFFRTTPAGVLTTLYSFSCSGTTCTQGALPVAGVVQASNGNFYGTTSSGGGCSTLVEGCGTVFEWSAKVALPPTFSPASVNFFNQAIDTTSAAKSVFIKNVNTGYSILDLNSITLSGSSDFAISANTCGSTLNAGTRCEVSLTYSPTVLETESATLNIADNAPGSPQTVALSGTGVAQATVNPTSRTFPETKVGSTSAAKNVTLENNLPTTLSGISYKTAAPFAVSSSTCGTTLASKTTCTISITFSPTAEGTANGTLTVRDSANDSPQTVSLTGTGG